MLSAILLLALMQPQDPGLSSAPAPDTTTAPVRTEKLTPAEVKTLADANQAVADAQAKLLEWQRDYNEVRPHSSRRAVWSRLQRTSQTN